MKSEIRSLIEPLICLSTFHITKETLDGIEGNAFHFPIVFYPNKYGAFVHVKEHDLLIEDIGGAPEDLGKVLEFASENGIVWIKFDRDGAILDDLPTYNSAWE